MIGAAREHEVEWLAPAPLWGTSTGPRAPAVVRFEGDDFMEQFARMLAPGPNRAANLLAARPAVVNGLPTLYQPLHGCYAMVCASLTCRMPGRPEKAVAPARGESVGFVLRRLDGDAQFAWVPTAGGEGVWTATTGTPPETGEEVIPLFPVPAPGDPTRRVWAGLVPTTSRETYRPGAAAATDPEKLRDRRLAELEDGPLAGLASGPINDPAAGNEAALQVALALAEFVNEYVLAGTGTIPTLLASPGLGASLHAAGVGTAMERAWADRPFLLGTGPRPDGTPVPNAGFTLPLNNDPRAAIESAVKAALPPLAPNVGRPTGTPQPKFDPPFPGDPVRRYAVRCVYLRAGCPPVAGAASEAFAVAALHDPDAPARTIRIAMPIDISIGALRRMKKNVGFVLSASLNAKAQALSGAKLKAIDEGDVPSGGIGLGEICTFALPIITLCAMIVLFIFLVLLNIAFFWLPLLKICFPIPKAKS